MGDSSDAISHVLMSLLGGMKVSISKCFVLIVQL